MYPFARTVFMENQGSLPAAFDATDASALNTTMVLQNYFRSSAQASRTTPEALWKR